jgi:hypothetical protein
MQRLRLRSQYRKGGIIGGLLKLIGLAVVLFVGLIILASRSSEPPEPGSPMAADAPAPVPIAPSAPQPKAANEEIEDCDPLPGEPVPKAGEEVLLVNDHGLKVVSIMRNGQFHHLPNPTRVRVLTGQPKKYRWGVFVSEGQYEVEVLEGEDHGVRGFASPHAMRFDRPEVEPEPLNPAEELQKERQKLIDRRKSKRASRARQRF